MREYIPEYLIEQRLRAYPAKYLKLGYYLEKQALVLEIYRVKDNFFQYLDLNYYFFANHPNSRVGITEIDKFPYIFLPFYINGLYLIFKNKNYLYFLLLFLSILFLSVRYDQIANPYLIYPFIIYAIYVSIKSIYEIYIQK